jgi:predicted permease
VHDVLQDIRFAIRAFARQPAHSLAALLSIAIGIGANTAIFSVAHALLMQPLPYRDADRLVILWNRSPGLNITEDWFSTAQYFDIKSSQSSLEDVAVALGSNLSLTGGGEPERIGAIRVSSNLLPMLGARPRYGRLFEPSEDVPGRGGSVILSHGTWARRYGSDPAVVGRILTLNGQPFEVVGVLPEGFSLPREVMPTLGVALDSEIFLPLPLAANAATIRTREDYNVLGKLKRGVAPEQAQAELDTLTARLRQEYPDLYPPNGGLTFSIVPLADQVVGDVRRPLGILLGAVGVVLLVACANVANLLLARALGRRQEMAVRAALGANRARVVRQLLTESLVLSMAGGVLGVGLAAGGVAWIHALQPPDVPRLGAIAINLPVLAFTVLISLVAGLLFGLAPIAGLRRFDLRASLQDAARGSAGAGSLWRRGHGLRPALAALEIGLAVLLLIGAGLLVRSFARLQNVHPGFEATGVLTVELAMTGRKYPDGPAVQQAYRALWERLDRQPGVVASGGVTTMPLSGFFAWGPITVEGRTPPPGEKFINADQRIVAGRYFEAMGIPLRAGRHFEPTDTADRDRVVIIDEFMARELWPGQDAVGKRIRLGDLNATGPWITVVGVVGRVKQYALETDGRIALYFPHTQVPARSLYVAVKTSRDPAALAAGVRHEIRELDADLPIYHLMPMTERVSGSLARRSFSMTLLGVFALVAVALASVGVYGVMAHLVAQGAREIGIRLALGATSAGIQVMVLMQGLIVAAAGIGAGLLAAAALTPLMRGLLFETGGRDPATFVAVALLLAVVAVAATYGPARRASRVDPMVALRRE